MKLQVLSLALCALFSATGAHAAKPAAAAAPAAAHAEDAQYKAAEALTEAQIKESKRRDMLSRLAKLYDGRDLPRFTWTLERLVELTPNAGDLRLQLAALYATQGDKTRSYDALLRLQAQGYAYDLSNDERFNKVHGTKVWDYLLANFAANSKPFGEGHVALSLPQGDKLFESIAWDAKRKQFVVGSAREGAIYLADSAGKLTDFIKTDAASGLWSVLDLKADAENDALWVVSAGVAVFKGYTADVVGKSQLLKYQLSSGKLLGSFTPEDGAKGHLFTTVALGKDGAVYVADGVKNEIYKLADKKLTMIAANPLLTAIRGLTVTDDGRTLYFADRTLGIFGIDLAQNKPFDVTHSTDRLVVGGANALYWFDGTLIIVQDGMIPERVMRLKLDKTGHQILSAMPLQASDPAMTQPGLGTLAGNDFYFIANSQKDLYDGYGVLRDEKMLEPTHIFKNDARFAWDQNGIPGGTGVIPVQKGDGTIIPAKNAAPKPIGK
ncbi:MAG: hypothetical protein ABI411_06655 [Tahibacter sp.]